MPKTSVYFPQDLHDQLSEMDLNISAICQEALRTAIEKETNKCSRCGSELPVESKVVKS